MIFKINCSEQKIEDLYILLLMRGFLQLSLPRFSWQKKQSVPKKIGQHFFLDT